MKYRNYSSITAHCLAPIMLMVTTSASTAQSPPVPLAKPVLCRSQDNHSGRFGALSRSESEFWQEVTSVLGVPALTTEELSTEDWTLRLIVFQSFRDLYEVTITNRAGVGSMSIRQWFRQKPYKTEHAYGFESNTSERPLNTTAVKQIHDKLNSLEIWNATPEREPLEDTCDGNSFLFELCDTKHGTKVISRTNKNEFSELISEVRMLIGNTNLRLWTDQRGRTPTPQEKQRSTQ